MGLLASIKRLFSATDSETAPSIAVTKTETYRDFLITPTPIKNGNLYRVSATISKGEQTHHLIRADEMSDQQECIALSLRKARLMIDQQGESLF